MLITVQDMLSLPLFERAAFIAGQDGKHTPIRWLVVLELLDDINQLQEGEILLTTAYDLQSCEDLKQNLVQKLVEKKVAGLIIQTGYYLDEVPESLIMTANRCHFPIIEIPKDMTFSALTKTVHQQIIHTQFEKMKFSEKIYAKLTELAKDNEGLVSFAVSIGEVIEADLFFYDNNFNKLCSSFHSEFSLDEALIQNTLIEHQQEFQSDYEQLHRFPLAKGAFLHIQPIHSKESIYGYLATIKDEPLNSFEEIAIGHTATIAALEFIKLLKFQEKDNQLKADFLELVLTSNDLDQLSIFSKAEALGYKISTQDTCVAIMKIDEGQSSQHDLLKLEQQIQQSILKQLQDYALEPLFKKLDNQFIMLLTNHYPNRMEIVEIMDKIAQHLHERYGVTTSAGIGSYCQHFNDYHLSYKEAQEALFIIEAVWKHNKRLHYKELGLYKLLLPLLEKESLMIEYYEHVLGKVLLNPKLLETLHVYLEDMQTNHAAEKLFIHRHTLKYRINKIEALTNRKLNHFQDRMELELALIIHNIFKEND